MNKKTYDISLIIFCILVLTVLIASAGSRHPLSESSMYKVPAPIVQDYGAPDRRYLKITYGADPLQVRNEDLAQAREAAIALEAEVREMVESMEVVR